MSIDQPPAAPRAIDPAALALPPTQPIDITAIVAQQLEQHPELQTRS